MTVEQIQKLNQLAIFLGVLIFASLFLDALLLAGLAGLAPSSTACQPTGASSTPAITETSEPTITATATATTSHTPTATTTPTDPPPPDPHDLPNRLANPGFEGSYRPVIFGEVNVASEWEPFYCDEPYMDEKCPAPRQGAGNPIDLLMGRPEFKSMDVYNYPEQVWEGEHSQTWFCFWRTCEAGVFQTFATNKGELYEVGAMVRSWYNYDNDGPSDLVSADDWLGSIWTIAIDTDSDSGVDNAFDPSLVTCNFQSTPDIQFYDNWVEISCRFMAGGSTATVYFRNLRTWPVANNDNYIDAAYAVQLTGDDDLLEWPTPTPIATPALGQ